VVIYTRAFLLNGTKLALIQFRKVQLNTIFDIIAFFGAEKLRNCIIVEDQLVARIVIASLFQWIYIAFIFLIQLPGPREP
jgi:hypothetical protein